MKSLLTVKYVVPASHNRERIVTETIDNTTAAYTAKLAEIKAKGGKFKSSDLTTAT